MRSVVVEEQPSLRGLSPRPGSRPRLFGFSLAVSDGALAWLSIAIGAALRLAYLLHHHVNSDEPQHLHVAWALGTGQLFYRDVFDNHAPLFSMMMAPLVRALGERADIVILMRFAMLPLVAVALAATWVIGRRLWHSRAGLWAVAIAAVFPGFIPASIEYRTDQLWMALWLASLAVLLGGPLTAGRSFVVGLLLGATLGASMKTSLLLVALMGAAIAVGLLAVRPMLMAPGWVASRALLLLAGFAVVPAGLSAYFALAGAWKPFLYCTVGHNIVPGLGLWKKAPWRPALFVVALPVLWFGARMLFERSRDAKAGARRALIFLTAGIYIAAIHCFWPLVTAQDSLPSIPMVAALGVPLVLGGRPGLPWRPLSVVALELVLLLSIEVPWRNFAVLQIDTLSEVLGLTGPGQSVMDLKGEAIYRPRPYYYALEALTQARLRAGLIRDDIAARLVATRTMVVLQDSYQFPERSRRFMNANYIGVGRWRAAGQWLIPAAGDPTRRRDFEIAIPARYAVISARGRGDGRVDGEPYRGPRVLAAGRHAYLPGPNEGRVGVVWADALERGFAPGTP